MLTSPGGVSRAMGTVLLDFHGQTSLEDRRSGWERQNEKQPTTLTVTGRKKNPNPTKQEELEIFENCWLQRREQAITAYFQK